jgi:hypothetical protein
VTSGSHHYSPVGSTVVISGTAWGSSGCSSAPAMERTIPDAKTAKAKRSATSLMIFTGIASLLPGSSPGGSEEDFRSVASSMRLFRPTVDSPVAGTSMDGMHLGDHLSGPGRPRPRG